MVEILPYKEATIRTNSTLWRCNWGAPKQSDPLTINCSIPQSSVIGWLLFQYINELPKLCKPVCVLFADDVYLLFKCHKQAFAYTNNDIINTFQTVQNWLICRNRQINNNVTKRIQFIPYKRQPFNLNIINQRF